MTDGEKIDDYIRRHARWRNQLLALRTIMQGTELVETVKWGAPAYTLDGKIVASIAGFRNHCALWFHQGVFLEDKAKKLVNAQEGATRGLRQWRFAADDEVDATLVKDYVMAAVANEKAGKRIKPQTRKVEIPEELAAALRKNAMLNTSFASLAPGRQREYAEYVGSAKREQTRLSRLEKITPMVLAGVGLYDKYKAGAKP